MTGAEVVKVPLKNDVHDLADMARIDADIAFVCNPHNPTGTAVSARAIDEFRAFTRAALIVVDEAYIEFADDPDETTAVPLVRDGNVAVLRTFSKYYGLAGARVGYLIATRELVTLLRSIRSPFSVGSLGQAAALAVLDDREFGTEMLREIQRNKLRTAELFAAAGYRPIPSQTNFMLVRCESAEAKLVDLLFEAGVSVRPGSQLGLPGAVRVTIPGREGLRLLESALAPLSTTDDAISTRREGSHRA
jgi:histidinol-phosphate aminotransferase